MKKKVLFVITSLTTGGIVRALQNYLNCYNRNEYDVDVFSMVHHGVYQGVLKNCKMLPMSKWLDASVAHLENRKGLGKAWSMLLKLADKVTEYKVQELLMKRIAHLMFNCKNYDAVIAFSEGLPTRFVSMMNHPNKIGWIHCDYASYRQLNGNHSELGIYEKLQHVVCVSEFTRVSFCNIYPTLSKKTTFIYNVIDDVMMRNKSKESIEEPFDNSSFNIVSVGRIDPVKRLSIVPELARKVSKAGCKIRWYLIGPKGTKGEVELLSKNMEKYETEDIVRFLGEKNNPYPYIANADLLVNTSVSEACPYVINEAKILGTPVVCTDFGSAKEFIDYDQSGYYEPIEKVADRIIWLINNPHILNRLKQHLSTFKYNNSHIISQIDSLL